MNSVSKVFAVLTIIGFLASCGGGGGGGGGGGTSTSSGTSTTSINGVALDGYLYNASVFLDLNGNGQFDAGEPSATTNSNGGYTLNATQDQLNSHSVIVLAQAGVTVDQDNPNTPITSAMTLIAPAGAPTVVSPITTHVAAKMATGLTLDQAKAATQNELGISSSEVLSDFLSSSGSGSDAHKVATAIAEVLKSVESSSNSGTSVAAKLSAIGTQVASKVTNNLSAIKQASSADEAKQIFHNVNQASNIYSIGGSISGLAARGLVLTNGLSTVRPSSSSTTFTFPLKQAENSTYSVAVSSNPEGQTCTVSNGSGIITSNSITNVAISCQRTPGQLSGTVSGLTTSGLKLTNGAEEISISSGATTFSFSTRILTGDSYSVSVTGQPTGKTCSVANASGNMSSNGVSNVQVTCANRAYTLGGSITGLTASGLKLKNSTEIIDISSGSVDFNFSNPLAYGSSFDISIDTQPLGVTCGISNNSGAGTVGSSNITSVVVYCNPQVFVIEGTITGITAGVTVSLDGTDMKDQVRNSDCHLSPDCPQSASNIRNFRINNIPAGTSYSLKADVPRTGYTCSITKQTGVLTADVAGVEITCRYTPQTYTYTYRSNYTSGSTCYLRFFELDNNIPPLTTFRVGDTIKAIPAPNCTSLPSVLDWSSTSQSKLNYLTSSVFLGTSNGEYSLYFNSYKAVGNHTLSFRHIYDILNMTWMTDGSLYVNVVNP